MRSWGRNAIGGNETRHSWFGVALLTMPQRRLSFVTAHGLEELREAAARGVLPPDFEVKLQKLAGGGLGHQFLEQNARALFRLLRAAREGSFPGVSQEDSDRLLEVLAYLRAGEDAIPDYRPKGFTDDQEVLRGALGRHGALFRRFKEWRLRNQVPALWESGHHGFASRLFQ